MPSVPLVTDDTLFNPKFQSYSLVVNALLPVTWKGELTGTTSFMMSLSAVSTGSNAPLATLTASSLASGSISATLTFGLFIKAMYIACLSESSRRVLSRDRRYDPLITLSGGTSLVGEI